MQQLLHLSVDRLPDIKLLAADIDGTLTKDGKFTPKLLQAIELLTTKGIQLLLVTGRSAGWVSAIANYLPITGAIAENGGLYFSGDRGDYDLLLPIENISEHRDRLAEVFWELQAHYPQLEESTDNQFRVTDWTFDVAGISNNQLAEIKAHCAARGWGFTYSTIQCHIKPIEQDKSAGILQVLKQYFPQIEPRQIITVGDSPNDETMFDRQLFPHSVGVANIEHYRDRLTHLPQYITNNSEVDGFCELVDYLLSIDIQVAK
jgi:hypothetical protein